MKSGEIQREKMKQKSPVKKRREEESLNIYHEEREEKIRYGLHSRGGRIAKIWRSVLKEESFCMKRALLKNEAAYFFVAFYAGNW